MLEGIEEALIPIDAEVGKERSVRRRMDHGGKTRPLQPGCEPVHPPDHACAQRNLPLVCALL